MNLLTISGKSGHEAEVANFIRAELESVGVPPTAIRTDNAQLRTPIRGNTGNLVVQLAGTQPGPRRLLMSHMDTVPICVGCKPVKKGRLVRSANPATGLGADNRAGVATTLTALWEIVRQDLPHPPLTFVWTVQEEIGLHGARLMNLGLLGKPRMAFNWDGGSPTRLTIGATGGYRLTITVHGLASHAGNAPEKGVSALAIAALAIADLQQAGWHGLVQKDGQTGTSNVGVIAGGEATNVVTDLVTIRAEARSHDPDFRQRIVNEFEAAFSRAVTQVQNVDGIAGKVSFQGQLDYESFRLATTESCVETALATVRDLGLEPELAIANGGLDANWLSARGIPTVTLGCGQQNPHMVTESLDLDQFHTACDIALALATGDR